MGYCRRTGWHSAAASALGEAFKKPTISREAVNGDAGLGRLLLEQLQ